MTTRPIARKHISVLALAGAVMLLMTVATRPIALSRVAHATPQAPPDNPIVVENQQPGSNGWMWTKVGDDVNQQIKGYASANSVNQNENLTFYVSVNPA